MNRFLAVLAFSFLCIATPAGAALSTNHSGWLWGSPEPQGNDLRALELQGNSGYAVGEFGTILRTTDGGSGWSTVRTGLMMDLARIDVIDGDSLVVASDCALRRSDDGAQTFVRLPFTASEARCARRLKAISFPTATDGYLLLDDGGVLKTADGGRSFSPRTAVPRDPADVAMTLAFGSANGGLATTSAGDIYRTTDGGSTWTRQHDGEKSLNGLLVVGTSAIAVGDAATFLVSDDGGDTWARPAGAPDAPPPPAADFTGVRCNIGGSCLMTTRTGQLARTADAGKSFQLVDAVANAVDYATPTRAVAVGISGRTLLSDDAGANFTQLGTQLSAAPVLTRMRATSATAAHAVGWRGSLARTTDGGETWASVSVATGEDLRDAWFPTADVGYALDAAGGLFRTENGGASWSILESGTDEAPSALFAPDADTVLLLGPRGMRRSTDAGQSFAVVRDGDVRVRTLSDVDRAGSGAIVAMGPRVIALSTDKGASWRRIVRPTQSAEVAHADFLSARIGYVVETDGRVYATGDRGRTWTESIAVGRADGRLLAFGDRRNGWLGLGSSPPSVLRTTDGGRSWRPQILGAGSLTALAAGGARAGFAALGDFGSPGLVFTQGGGDAGTATALSLSTSKRKITKTTRVRIVGRMRPARTGAPVAVLTRDLKGGRWRTLFATVDDDGRFAVGHRIKRSTVFVAQWAGDPRSAGDGSQALVVKRVPRR